MTRLPPLASLEAFEAAARHGNFSRAAAERHLTHSAISRHIQTLEHWYGTALFIRTGPRIQLTDDGHQLAARLSESLQTLHQALARGKHDDLPVPLQILTLPSLAATWLLPRLVAFTQRHPAIQLSIQTAYEMASMPPHIPTIALRFGTFDRAGLAVDLLMHEMLVPAAAPAWIAQHGTEPWHWPAAQMLRHRDAPWPRHVIAPNGSRRVLAQASGMEFNDALLLIQAAQLGLGVAWIRAGLARQAAADGHLQLLDDYSTDSGKAYWLAYRAEMANHSAIAAFRDWMQRQIGRSPSAE